MPITGRVFLIGSFTLYQTEMRKIVKLRVVKIWYTVCQVSILRALVQLFKDKSGDLMERAIKTGEGFTSMAVVKDFSSFLLSELQ